MLIHPRSSRNLIIDQAAWAHKLKSGLPSKATPEEAKAVIAGSIAYFGKYWLDETSMVLSLDVHASTFANLTGNPSEMRNITSLTDSELKFTRPFVKDVTLEAVFKRGQSRHFGRRPTSSGLPPEADIVKARRHVSKLPTPDLTTRTYSARRRTRLISAGEQIGTSGVAVCCGALSSLSSRVSKDRRESGSACYRLQKSAA